MSVFVVDASIIVKWFVPEIHSDAAQRLLATPHRYFAPDLVFVEAASAIWKKVRRREIGSEDGPRLVADINRVAVDSVPCRALTRDAYPLAAAAGQTVYDALYVALAVRLDTRVLTADDRLVNALASVPTLAGYVQHVRER